MLESCVVIPSRWGSQRFPGKPLATIAGKSMINHVLERALSSSAETVIVATDDERIYEKCEGYSVMTGECPNGTARMIEVSKKIQSKIYVNVQGDEPLVDPYDIDMLIQRCQEMKGIHTLMTHLRADDVPNYNAVKVITDNENSCLSFSRTSSKNLPEKLLKEMKHIGIYCFDANSLQRISGMQPTPSSLRENLEQLTWMDYGIQIYAWSTSNKYQAVDSPEDIDKVIEILNENSLRHTHI